MNFTPLYLRAIWIGARDLAILLALIFLPVWTFHYWQGWVFLLTVTVPVIAMTIYMAIYDPKLLERRLHGGPGAEPKNSQKLIIVFIQLSFICSVLFPVLDHRFGWSAVPMSISLVGDALVVLGFIFIFLVMKENSYAASTVQVYENQMVISTGPYARVRHPMYTGVLIIILGVPLALGSWYGLAGLLVVLSVLIWRLMDEEKFLSKNLLGYLEYKNKVRTRLIPGLF